MPEGHFGGGGSVFWTIKTDPTRSTRKLSLKQTLDNGVYTENGTDRSQGAGYGRNFVISFLPPKGVAAEEFIRDFSRYAMPKGGRVQFSLPIERQPEVAKEMYRPQIVVGWGRFRGVPGTSGISRRPKSTRRRSR